MAKLRINSNPNIIIKTIIISSSIMMTNFFRGILVFIGCLLIDYHMCISFIIRQKADGKKHLRKKDLFKPVIFSLLVDKQRHRMPFTWHPVLNSFRFIS